MKHYLKAENLKQKGSSTRKLIVSVPVIFLLFSFTMTIFLQGGINGGYFLAVSYNWFPLLIVPTVVALLSSQVVLQEKKNNCNAHNLSLGLSLKCVWLSKIVIVSCYFVLMMGVVLTIIASIEFFWLHESISLMDLFIATLVIIIANLPFIPLIMFLTERIGRIVPLIGHFVLSVVSVGGATGNWFLNPWAWTIRMLAPIIGVHPNGQLLSAGDPLRDMSVVWIGCMMALSMFLLLIIMTTKLKMRGEKSDEY